MFLGNKFLVILLIAGLLGTAFYLAQPGADLTSTVIEENRELASSTNKVSSGSNIRSSNSASNTPLVVTPVSDGAADSFVLLPSPGDVWSMNKSHEIRWNKGSNRSGYIVLVNSGSNEVVGWVTTSLIPKQTTYSWNTKSVQVSRANPAQVGINPGSYYLQIVFDGASGSIRSDNFVITNSSSEIISTVQVRIFNQNFSPNYIEIVRGQKVIIINGSFNNNETILMGGVALAVLLPGHSYLIDTSEMKPGSYEARLSSSAIARLTLVIK